MTFKEFRSWCNERACDGYWGFVEAVTCTDILTKVQKEKFWNREKVWQKEYAWYVIPNVIDPINKRINEMNASI